MKYWLITDTHFNHKKMQEYCGRPNDFEQLILAYLITMVRYDDVLIHLGDICIGNDAKWHKALVDCTGKCKRWLVKGNHDNKSDHWYLTHGWDMVCGKIQIRYGNKNILFSHTPVRYTEEKSSLFISDSFDLNIHGHFHNNLHRIQEGRFVVDGEKERNEVDLKNITDKHRLLSIEETNYKPVLLDTFI